MSKSTFRILIVILLGAFVLVFAFSQIKLTPETAGNDSTSTTEDVEAEEVNSPKAELPPSNPIGFDYRINQKEDPSQSTEQG